MFKILIFQNFEETECDSIPSPWIEYFKPPGKISRFAMENFNQNNMGPSCEHVLNKTFISKLKRRSKNLVESYPLKTIVSVVQLIRILYTS